MSNSCKYDLEVATHLNVHLQDKLHLLRCQVCHDLQWNKVLRSWSSLQLLLAGRELPLVRRLRPRVRRQPLHPRRTHYIYQESFNPGGWPRNSPLSRTCCIDDKVSTVVGSKIEENTEENLSKLTKESVNAKK